MRGYIQPGNTITLPAPYAVASGDGLLVGAIFGIATGSAAINAEVETLTEGVVELKVTGLPELPPVATSGTLPDGL